MSKSYGGKTYYSFDDLAVEEFGMKPLNRKTNDTQKLAAQQEKFEGVCPYCKQRAHFIPGTNVVVCTNPQCKGKKITYKVDTESGEEEYAKYSPFVKILSEKAGEIGNTIFGE